MDRNFPPRAPLARSHGSAVAASNCPDELHEAAEHYAQAARAHNTKKAYTTDFAQFCTWCELQDDAALPASGTTVALYITWLARQGRKVSTIERALVAISQAHKLQGLPSPRSAAEVRDVLKGIRRELGIAQEHKAPLVVDALRQLLEPFTLSKPIDLRDRALLTLGFAGGFRRSELVALDDSDLVLGNDGLTLTIRRSKTDQEGAGRTIGIPFGGTPLTCPVRAVRDWLDMSEVTDGPLFRGVRHGKVSEARLTDQMVARIVKKRALAVGLDPSVLAGHSLRSGFATTAAKCGKTERAIMRQTGHRSISVVRRYIRDGALFEDNAAAGIGL